MKKQLAPSQFNLMDMFTNKTFVSELNAERTLALLNDKVKQFSKLVITVAHFQDQNDF